MTAPVAPGFRLATAADAPAVARLHIASWRDAYRGLLPDDLLDTGIEPWAHALWERTLAAPPAGFVLLDEACFAALWLRGEEAYLDSLHVAPAARGRGLGRQLLRAAFARATEAGAHRATLRAIAGNEAAIRFYLRLGGQAVEPLEPGEVAGHTVLLRRIAFPDLAAMVAETA